MDWLSDIIQDWLYDVLVGSAQGFFDALSGLTTNVADLTDVNPETFNADLFATIQSISDVAIVPVASLILCYLMTIHFIKIVQDRNTYKDMSFMPVFKWILTTTIGIILVTKTYDIVLAIFDVVGWILTQTGTVLAETDVNMNLQESLTTLVESVDKEDMGTIELGDEINLKETTLGEATFKINKVSFVPSYIYEYQYCHTEKQCEIKQDVVTAKAGKLLVVVDDEIKYDKNSSFYKNTKQEFYKYFGKTSYLYENNEFVNKMKDVTPTRMKNGRVYEVSSTINFATNKKIIITIRNKYFTVNLE